MHLDSFMRSNCGRYFVLYVGGRLISAVIGSCASNPPNVRLSAKRLADDSWQNPALQPHEHTLVLIRGLAGFEGNALRLLKAGVRRRLRHPRVALITPPVLLYVWQVEALLVASVHRVVVRSPWVNFD